MKDVAIIASVIPQRFELLERSLVTWQKSILDSGLNAHIYLYIEGATIAEVMKYIPVGVGVSLAGGEERSGSHVKGYNFWLDNSEAKVYVMTHPEILFPKDTIKVAFENATQDTFAAFKVFWLPDHMLKHFDDYTWQQPETLEQCEDIYKLDPKQKGEFYWNKDTRGITNWQSTTTYAMNGETIRKMLPFPDFGSWGADDPWHLLKRKELGIQNVTIMEPILMHQYHSTLQTLSIEEIVTAAKAKADENPTLSQN